MYTLNANVLNYLRHFPKLLTLILQYNYNVLQQQKRPFLVFFRVSKRYLIHGFSRFFTLRFSQTVDITYFPQHCLYLRPEPHGHGSFLPTFLFLLTLGFFFTVSSESFVNNCSFGVCSTLSIFCLISAFSRYTDMSLSQMKKLKQ